MAHVLFIIITEKGEYIYMKNRGLKRTIKQNIFSVLWFYYDNYEYIKVKKLSLIHVQNGFLVHQYYHLYK